MSLLLGILTSQICGAQDSDTGVSSPAVTEQGAQLQQLGNDFAFTEGPSADKEGNVYFTDQPNDRIVRWDAKTGKLSDWLKPAGRSNGTFFDESGNLVTCADGANELWTINSDKKASVVTIGFDGKSLNGPNDLWIRPDGGLYFTDPLYKRPYWKRDPSMQQVGQHVYFLPKGKRRAIRVADDLEQPNGIIGTPDGKTLYVADIRAKKTYAYQIQPDGKLSDKKLFCELGSDGMTIDNEGNVYLTGRGVTVFNPRGKKIQSIPVPVGWTANVTFGGADQKLLFITASKSVFGIRMRTSGVSPF
ncbi:MAG: SMP-30/gluconolactonase/LRE family protein [Verrucomicrobia bacterium]|nr:SMP-30/gluconolactonase/LRE family protein [Verrucomicrobiota bacterium]